MIWGCRGRVEKGIGTSLTAHCRRVANEGARASRRASKVGRTIPPTRYPASSDSAALLNAPLFFGATWL